MPISMTVWKCLRSEQKKVWQSQTVQLMNWLSLQRQLPNVSLQSLQNSTKNTSLISTLTKAFMGYKSKPGAARFTHILWCPPLSWWWTQVTSATSSYADSTCCRCAKNQHLPGLRGGEWDLHHILPCLILRIRVKSEAQPIGTKQPSVLDAQKYCLDEEVWLSSSGNLSVCIYINFRLSSLAQAVWNDIDSVRSRSGVINWGLTTP